MHLAIGECLAERHWMLLSTLERGKLSFRSCLPTRYDTMPKAILQWTVEGDRPSGKPRTYIMEGPHQRMGRPVTVVIAANGQP